MGLSSFIPVEGQKQIVDAIEKAERLTSGEIRVHIEPKCKSESAYERAVEVFDQLKMHETAARNGVLLYIAYKSHKFAIIGDKGINEVVPENFWDTAKDLLAGHLAAGSAVGGICTVISMAGENLAKFFPVQEDDINEQSNEISYGE